MKKFFFALFAICLPLFLSVTPSHAATLTNASDTLSTSRPSASSFLYQDQASGDSAATVWDNGSIYLSSDSAKLVPDSAGETFTENTVASMNGQTNLTTDPPGAPVNGTGPIGWWKMDETSWNGTSGEVVDSSGNGNNGTAHCNGTGCSVPTTTIGKFGNSGSFDGTDQYVSTTTNISCSLNQSASAWFNGSSAGHNRSLFNLVGCGNYFLVYFTISNTIAFYPHNASGMATTTTYTEGAWHYVAVTTQQINSTQVDARIYVDGVLAKQANLTFTAPGTANHFYIGSLGSSNTNLFSGSLDDVRLYNYALTASQVAQLYNNGPVRTIYFTSGIGSSHHAGDTVYVPVTALHTVKFTVVNNIPSGGSITLIFPGGGSSASPSASGFAFNGLSPPSVKVDGANCTITVSSPRITCTTSSAVSSGVVVTILVGCTAQSGGVCSSPLPTLINPVKRGSGTSGTADNWKMGIVTADGSGNVLDQATVTVGTVESVQVQGTVDPTLTFTIAGVNNGSSINTGNTTGCTNTETTNTGVASNATSVNMGILPQTGINIGAQLLTIATNAENGYSLTATSSGHLLAPENGHFIPDNTIPSVMTAGTPFFGLHPCGLDVNTTTWGSGTTGSESGAKYGWPTSTTSVLLASDSEGPVGNAITTGNGLVSVEYGGTVDGTVPAGVYTTTITYVVTAEF